MKSKLQDVHCTALRRSRFAAAKAVPLVVGTIPEKAAPAAPAAPAVPAVPAARAEPPGPAALAAPAAPVAPAAPAMEAMQAMPSTSSISSGAEYEDVDAMLNEVIASPVPPL